MTSNNEPDANDSELISHLKRLSPLPAPIDPLAAAFAAGRRTSAHKIRLYQRTTALAAAMCATAWFFALTPPTPRQPDPPRLAVRTEPAIIYSDQSIAVLQQAVLVHGLDGLPRIDRSYLTPTRISDPF